VSTIAEWLSSLDLPEHTQRFTENDIDLSVVCDLTDQDLKDIGIPWVIVGSRSAPRLPSPEIIP
jgi:hypothetical protein